MRKTTIERSIKIKNVCELLTEVYARDLISLKKKCITFVLKHFDRVIVQNEFLDLQKPILKDIFKSVARKGVTVKDVGN